VSFIGSVLLVTHDRYFLDKVATSILSFEGAGKVVRYPGNYDTYRRLKAQRSDTHLEVKPASLTAAAGPREPRKQAKLGYLQQRELDGMQMAIEGAERRKAEIETALADPSNYSNAEKVLELSGKLSSVNAEIERLYSRWQELEHE
jgi:ATP-binding cassette subfamily F protein uup